MQQTSAKFNGGCDQNAAFYSGVFLENEKSFAKFNCNFRK